MTLAPVPLRPLVDEVVAVASLRAQRGLAHCPSLPTVMADTALLRQLYLQQVLGNAVSSLRPALQRWWIFTVASGSLGLPAAGTTTVWAIGPAGSPVQSVWPLAHGQASLTALAWAWCCAAKPWRAWAQR